MVSRIPTKKTESDSAYGTVENNSASVNIEVLGICLQGAPRGGEPGSVVKNPNTASQAQQWSSTTSHRLSLSAWSLERNGQLIRVDLVVIFRLASKIVNIRTGDLLRNCIEDHYGRFPFASGVWCG